LSVAAGVALVAGMLVALAGTAQAATKYWTGGATPSAQRQVWTNAFNWGSAPGGTGDGMPGSGDDVIIDHNSTNAPLLNFNILTLPYTINSLTIGTNTAAGYTNSTLTIANGNVSNKILNVTLDVLIGATGTVTHAAETSTSTSIDTENHRLCMVVGGNMTIALGGKINVTGRGYTGNAGPGTGNSHNAAAAGHGGEGGNYLTNVGGTTYGSVTNPVNSGSGDAGYNLAGAAGGGVVRLAIAGGLTLNGSILADAYLPGTAYQYGRCAGGSVNISAATLAGNGSIYARGADGSSDVGDAGAGGGRIAVVLTNADDTAFAGLAAIRANGGNDTTIWGAAGTIYLKGTNQTYGSVIVDNNGYAAYPSASTLIKNQTLLLDRIVATNSGVVIMGSGGILDLTQGCALRSYGSSRFIPTGGQILWPAAYTLTNVTLSWSGTGGIAITSDVTVASGALLTHETITSTGSNPENHKLIASIVGNLTVASGGQINVSAKGYGQDQGPGGFVNGTIGGGSHGGEGGRINSTTYGSVTNPVRAGTGGEIMNNGGGNAGGVALLIIRDGLTVNGTIAADGQVVANTLVDGYGAGGSVNIVAASLAGSGTISANGGYQTGTGSGSGGGGGRIAVVLTNADDTAFAGLAAIRAYGGPLKGAYENGAAGTVYLKGTNTVYGRLLVDNTNSATRRTLVGPLVTDATVGDVLIRNRGYLGLTNQTLTVYGSWSNGASFLANAGGIVKFDGTGALGTNTLFGSSTFSSVICTNAGKTLLFQAGKTNTIMTALNIAGASGGAGNAISLLPATAGQQWFIKVTNSITPTLSYLIVSNSTAVTTANGQTLAATFSTVADVGVDNSLGINTNWLFPSPQPKVWDGSASTSWRNDENWTPPGVPTPIDVSITIPSGGNQPVLNASYLNYTCPFTIESGASLSLGGWNMTLGGLVTNAGTIIATGSETLTFTSNVVFTATGQFTPASSTVILNGSGAQSATLNGQTFYNLSIANANAVTVTDSFAARNLTFPATGANVTFGDGFAVTNLTLSVTGAATLNFAATKTYTVRNALYLRGASSANRAVLTSSGTWYLNAPGYYTARQLSVANSDATGSGKILYAVDSVDGGGSSCTYWNFGTGNKLWAGTNTAWATDGNWLPSGAPVASSMVFIDGSTNTIPKVSAATTIAGLTMAGFAGAAGLTVDMPFAGPDSLAVSGDVNILTNATVTHTQGNETYRLAMNIVGNLTIYGGGKIDVTGKGFTSGSPGAPSIIRNGAGHGGEGGGTAGGTTYGSVTNPVRCGSYGNGGDIIAGGGVVKLTIGGTLTLNANASIQADGAVGSGNESGGSGGSVNIAAAALAGSGRISANGGRGNNAGTPGPGAGGGRIALVLTNNNDSAFDAWLANTNITAYGGRGSGGSTEAGGAGTVYLKGADRTYGRLIVDNSTNSTTRRTLLNSAVTDKTVGDVVLRNQGYMSITNVETLTVYGSWSNAVATNAISGGTVEFAGAAPATIWGGNTWSNLTITTAGKVVSFEHSKTQTVYGIPAFSNVTLRSTLDNTQWHLRKSGNGYQDVGVVTVSDSNAGTAGTHLTFRGAIGSVVSDPQNDNWGSFKAKGTMILLR
jgi:hypothetical protein